MTFLHHLFFCERKDGIRNEAQYIPKLERRPPENKNYNEALRLPCLCPRGTPTTAGTDEAGEVRLPAEELQSLETLQEPTPRSTNHDASITTVAHQQLSHQRRRSNARNPTFLRSHRPPPQIQRHQRRWPGKSIPWGQIDHPPFCKGGDH